MKEAYQKPLPVTLGAARDLKYTIGQMCRCGASRHCAHSKKECFAKTRSLSRVHSMVWASNYTLGRNVTDLEMKIARS